MTKWYAAHAYTPNEAAVYGGGDHVILMEELHMGRIHRKPEDLLCRPSKKFWGLHTLEVGREVTCKRCRELLIRMGEPTVSYLTWQNSLARTLETPPNPTVVEEPSKRDPNFTLEQWLSTIFKG